MTDKQTSSKIVLYARGATQLFAEALRSAPQATLIQLNRIYPSFFAFLLELAGEDQEAQKALDSVETFAIYMADKWKREGWTHIVITQADYLPHGSADFFRYLVKSDLPARILVQGRWLSRQIWGQLVDDGLAAVIGDKTPGGPLFNPNAAGKHHLEMYGFRRGEVFVDGEPADTSVGGPLARNLFYYLVDKPLATRDEIFEVFWPDLPVKEATNVFHVTKRKISEILGFELTTYKGGFYKPNRTEVERHYDVAEFEEAAFAENWTRAIELYRGEFLAQLDMPWVENRRRQLAHLYTEQLLGEARRLQENGEVGSALGFFLRAHREEPIREDIARGVMACYVAMKEGNKALTFYNAFMLKLRLELGISPSKLTLAFVKQIATETGV